MKCHFWVALSHNVKYRFFTSKGKVNSPQLGSARNRADFNFAVFLLT